MVAAELGCVLLPTVAFVAMRPDLRRRRGGAPPGIAPLVAGLLVGSATFYLLTAGIEPLLDRLWPPPAGLRAALRELLLPASGVRPLVVDLLGFALLPAVAEELLFRGLVYAALRRHLGTLATVAVAALLFGLFHGLARLPAALLGGLALGVVRAAAGLGPAMVAHLANNAWVIVALRLGYETPPLRLDLTAGALLAVGAAWRLLGVARSGTQPRDQP